MALWADIVVGFSEIADRVVFRLAGLVPVQAAAGSNQCLVTKR